MLTINITFHLNALYVVLLLTNVGQAYVNKEKTEKE